MVCASILKNFWCKVSTSFGSQFLSLQNSSREEGLFLQVFLNHCDDSKFCLVEAEDEVLTSCPVNVKDKKNISHNVACTMTSACYSGASISFEVGGDESWN